MFYLVLQVCFYVMVGQINSEAAAATQSNHHCTRLLGRRRPRHSKSVRLNSQGAPERACVRDHGDAHG